VVQGAKVVGVFSRVLLIVGLVNPAKGVHEPVEDVSWSGCIWSTEVLHPIQCRSDVAHHSHEEEGYLEDGVLQVV
jgi:hypothetical protein